jgi:hypothetical protein
MATKQDFTNEEYLNKMKHANESLGISDDFTSEKNKNIIFVYTPPKVGSTTLVSSIRINACGKFTVLHLHNEIMLKILYKITDVTVLDIIKYNKFLGKTVYVIDIYRSPIEQKISTFFENIHSFHFNVPIEILNTFEIERIIKRFNQVFPYLLTNDNFRTKYNVPVPETFDFNKKFISSEVDGIKYFKIRLKDSDEWRNILKNVLGFEIYIANDYETNKKPVNKLFSTFKHCYKIPINLFESIENDDNLKYYYSDEERKQYLSSWIIKNDKTRVLTFTPEEYVFYSDMSLDNRHISEIQMDHYIDLGCLCMGCCRKRGLLLFKLQRGEQITEKINHYDAGADYLKAKAKRVPVYLKVNNNNSRNVEILKSNFMKVLR